MLKEPIFGEWLTLCTKGIGLRLVIEEMNGASAAPSVANAKLTTRPDEVPKLFFSSGTPSWPWRGTADDHAPTITWRFSRETEFLSLKVEQTGETEWIRRYRLEVTRDGQVWRVITPSRLIDAYHRQPCVLRNQLETLESCLLPAGRGTQWVQSFWEDFMLRTIEPLGLDSPYPEWLPGRYFIAAAVRPFTFGGVYNSGDVANFDALIAAILSPEMAVESQQIFSHLINRFGFMPGVMDPGYKDDRAFALDYSGMIWGPCCYWDIFAWVQNREYLGWFADACAKWARWWLANRDKNGDGWLEPGVNGFKPSTQEFRVQGAKANPKIASLCPEFWDYVGLHNSNRSAFNLSIYESPWDDYPVFLRGRHRGMRFNSETGSLSIHFIETQLYASLLAGFVSYAYRALGRLEEAKFFARESTRLSTLVRDNCWDEPTGLYYDCDADTGKLRNFVKHLGGFVPMMMGLPTLKQARRMVEHLTNPKEFWTPYPVPTISRDSPDYSPNGYWSGRAWPPTNFFVLRGLLNYGFFDVADELLRRWISLTQTCVDRPVQYVTIPGYGEGPYDQRFARVPDVQWIVPENWNPETGIVSHSGGLTWGGLWLPAVIMRHFWPVGEDCALLRPGGNFRMDWGKRWKVDIDGERACVNGRSFRFSERTTYRLNDATGEITALEPGRADPVVFLR